MAGSWLTLLAITVRLGASCPPSCSACSRDVTLCQKLTYIPEAPLTTRALMVTDGFIITVEGTNLSFLLNVTVLILSRNCILDIREDAFHGLPGLQTLLLEYNQISSSSITNTTFQELRNLQVLALSNNFLDSVQGTWFRNTSGLLRLLLNGNRIQNLTQITFVGANLADLRYLDLSNNLIRYLGEGTFQALPNLREVDLSGNDLAHIPDVFAPLTSIIFQGLDRKEWRCTCDLQPLALLLRNSTPNASAHISGSAKDLTCRSPAVAQAEAVSGMLRWSKADCDYKAPNMTLVFKDKTDSPSGREVAQVTLLCLSGAVGLTCLILAILNWKLQSKARLTSENLCGRALCAHEPRNDSMEEYCNCHLPQENEIQVMSIVGSGKEMPLLQEHGHPAMLGSVSESTGLKTSFRNLRQEKGCGQDNASFLCFNCRLVQSGLPENSGNMVAIDEASLPTRHFQRRVEKLRHFEPGKIQTQTFQWSSERTMDTGSDTLNGRGSTPTSSLARESLDTHFTNELWQPPTGTRDDGFQPHQQRHFITSSSTKLHRPKEYRVQKYTRNTCSQCLGPHGLPQDDSLICKYIPCDRVQCHTNEKRANYREHLKSHRNRIQGNNPVSDLFSSGDKVRLPTRAQKKQVRKKVSFHIPDLDKEDGLALLLTDSTEAGALWIQPQNSCDQVAVCHSEKPSKTKGGRCSSDAQMQEKEQTKAPHSKRKMKGQNLNIRLNLHPFRKLRIHPEKQPDREKCPPKSSRQGKNIVEQKSSKVSEEETIQKERGSLVGPRGHLEQTESSGNRRTAPKTLTPNATNKQVSGGSQRIPHLTLVMSGVSTSPREHARHIPGEVPRQGHAEAVISPESPGVLSGSPPHSSPKERMGSVVIPSSSVLSSSSGSGQGQPTDHIKPQHFQTVADQVTKETTEAGEGHMSHHTLGQKEKYDSFTSKNETQPVHEIKPDTNQKDLSPEEMLPHKLQHSQEDIAKRQTNTSSQVITNGGLTSLNKNDFGVESHDSSLVPQTQLNSDITFVETKLISHQHRLEFSNNINTPLLGTQTHWLPTSRSKKGTHVTNGLPIDDVRKAPREKMREGENKETAQSNNACHGAVIQAKETWESQKLGNSDLQAFLGSNLVMQNGVSSSRSPEVKARLLPSETGPPISNDTMRHHVQEVQEIRPEEGYNERGEDTVSSEKRGDASF